MRLLSNPTLRDDPLLERVWEQLGRPGGCCVTGGYVRDRILGRPSRDLDLSIAGGADDAASPARRLASAHGVRAHLLGTAPHRVWRVETASLKVELWPMGELTREEDALRRDFGCNALSWELPDGPLVDHVGGVDDLEKRRFRAISRFNLIDDPVRLLRAPRFLAQLTGFELDGQTRSWVRELAPALADAPRERVGQELQALLRAPSASRGLCELKALGLFHPAAPAGSEVDERWFAAHLDAADRLADARRHPLRGAYRMTGDSARFALLIHAWGNPTAGKLARYAWSKTERDTALRAATMLADARLMVVAPPADRRELAWRAGTAFPTLIAFASALEPDQPGWRRWWRQYQRDPAAIENPQPLLSGDAITAITGMTPGPKLGAIVKALLRAQVRGDIRTRGGAIDWLLSMPPASPIGR